MKKNRTILILLAAAAAVVLSACGTPPVNAWPGLAADTERAYVGSGAYVIAVNLDDGTEAWRYPAKAEGGLQFFTSLALTEDGQLLAGSAGTQHALLSLDPATGRANWAQPFMQASGIWLAPALMTGGRIYAPNSDGWLYALEADGAPAGKVELGGSLWSAPVSDGKLLYVASLDHHLHIVNPETLATVQTVDLEAAIPGGPTPALDGVYVGSFSGKLEFVSASGGRETVFEGEDWIWGAPALSSETLYFADLGGKVYSLDLPTGRQNWSGIQPDGPVAASPLVEGERVVVVTEAGSVHAFDAAGNEAWPRPYETGGKIYTSPVASGELILIAPYQAQFMLAALDQDGRQAWLFTPAG